MGGDGSNLKVKVVTYCKNDWCRKPFTTTPRHKGNSQCPDCRPQYYRDKAKRWEKNHPGRKRLTSPTPGGLPARYTEAEYNLIKAEIDELLDGDRIPRSLLQKHFISYSTAERIKKGWRPKRFADWSQ